MQLYKMTYPEFLKKRKSLEQKYEYNFFVLWLSHATVACFFFYFFFVRVDLAHPFWALVTFPITFSVLGSWEISSNMGKKWSTQT